MRRTSKPTRCTHRNGRVYTRLGFRTKVIPHLLRDGFRPHEVRKLEKMYFGGQGMERYQTETGSYRNKRCFNLSGMSRHELQFDRKRWFFELAERSGMFYVLYDAEGRVSEVVSPYVLRKRGVIPLI